MDTINGHEQNAFEKKLEENYTRILRAILTKILEATPTKQQLYSHLPRISKIIQVRRTRRAGHFCGSKVELIRNILLWTPTYRRASFGWPVRTYLHQLCADRCGLKYLRGAMDDWNRWKESTKSMLFVGLDDDDDDDWVFIIRWLFSFKKYRWIFYYLQRTLNC